MHPNRNPARAKWTLFSPLMSGAQLYVTIQWVPDPDQPSHHGVPAGKLLVTPINATGLRKPDKIIRDLSTYVDYTSAYMALLCFGLYLVAGFAFYQVRVLLELVGHANASSSDAVGHEYQSH